MLYPSATCGRSAVSVWLAVFSSAVWAQNNSPPPPPLPPTTTSWGPSWSGGGWGWSTTESTETTGSTTTASTATVTYPVVSLFYLDPPAAPNQPFTLTPRDFGVVIGVDASATTYVVTSTHTVPSWPPSTSSSGPPPASVTPGPPPPQPLSPSPSPVIQRDGNSNATGTPTTITQGPSTFAFTSSDVNVANKTLVNQCQLSGTTSATCSMTRVGEAWYAGDRRFNGTWSTYNYTWSTGDPWGYAPVTITSGASLLQGGATATSNSSAAASSSTGGAAGARLGRMNEAYWLLCVVSVVWAFVLGIFVVV